MKIVFISGNLCDGGAQRVIAIVSSRLAAQGNDVTLLLFSRNPKEYCVDGRVKIRSLATNYEEYSKISTIKKLSNVRKILKSINPDVGVGFLEGGYALGLASIGMKFSKIASARIDPSILIRQKGLRARIDRLWFRSANAVVLQNETQVAHSKNLNWHNITVIPNPIPNDALIGLEHIYSKDCYNLLMIGRLAQQKNYCMAVDAMKIVCDKYPLVKMNIFGKGGEEEKIKGYIKENKLENSIVINGWTQDVQGEYKKNDLFILCSDYEGMPNALMEAMAAGLICISTDCDTGPSELIRNKENGMLVPVGDAKQLADSIINVIEMQENDRKQLGQNAYLEIAEKYNSIAIANKWENLFKKLRSKSK